MAGHYYAFGTSVGCFDGWLMGLSRGVAKFLRRVGLIAVKRVVGATI